MTLLTLPAMAQNSNKQLTLEELMWGGTDYWNRQPKNIYANFWGDKLVELNVEDVKMLTDDKGRRAKYEPLFTAEEVNAAIDTAKYGKVYNLMGTSFPYADQPVALLSTQKLRLLYNWKKKQVEWQQPVTAGAQARNFNTSSRAEAFVKDWNIYVTNAKGETVQVTTDGNRELQYGMSVHRDEFGIHSGLFWSPKGNSLAFYRMDQTMVTDFPLVDNTPRVAQLAPEKYPMAGMTSHKVTVGVYNPTTGKTLYLQAGDPTDRYFTNIAWSPDEKTIYMFELPRTQDKAELVAYDAQTGARKGCDLH